jgi:hypothetical protein
LHHKECYTLVYLSLLRRKVDLNHVNKQTTTIMKNKIIKCMYIFKPLSGINQI